MNRIDEMVDELLGMTGHKRLAEIEYVRHRLTYQPTNLILHYHKLEGKFYNLVGSSYGVPFTSDELRSILNNVERVLEL